MIWLLTQHLVVIAFLIGLVGCAGWLLRPHPAVQHALWAVVLLKFVIPPVVSWPWSAEEIVQAFPLTQSERGASVDVGVDSDRDLAWVPTKSDERGADSESGATGFGFGDGLESTVSDRRSAILTTGPGIAAASTSLARWWGHFRRLVLPPLFALWMMGTLVFGALTALRIVRLRCLVERGRTGPDWLVSGVAKQSRRMGIRSPQLVLSDEVVIPFIWCFPSRRLVWPTAHVDGLARAQIDCMIVHELAHLRRRDHWVAWLALVVQVLWWWNPMAWYVRRRLTDMAELACDAWVVSRLPQHRRTYADVLVSLSEKNSLAVSLPTPAIVAGAGARRSFERRLVMIMSRSSQLAPRRLAWLSAAGLLLLAAPALALATHEQEETAQQPVPDQSEARTLRPLDDPADVTGSIEKPKAVAERDTPQLNGTLDLQVLQEILEKLSADADAGLDQQALVEAAIEGMLKKADAEAVFLGPSAVEELQVSMSGVVGIGVAVKMAEGNLQVMQPLRRSPAARAGIQSGDIIEEIDGQPVESLGSIEERLPAAVKLIRGKPGKPVTLGVRHADSDSLQQIEIVRGPIQMETVRGVSLDSDSQWHFAFAGKPKIGYLRLTAFHKGTAKDFEEAVRRLEADGAQGLVLDLRDCPGGLLDESVRIADLFLKQGTIVRVEGTTGAIETRDYEATPGATLEDVPIVVLIGQGTASAAEILAACLKDHDRAILVGERTFGRGIVQSIVPLKSGGGALRLTAAKTVRANGKYIHRSGNRDTPGDWGVRPNSGCELRVPDPQQHQLLEQRQRLESRTGPATQAEDLQDPQLQKAIDRLRAKLDS